MPSPIIARADALMQRRRNTIADLEDVPVLTDTVNGEEDYPVLLDIDKPPAIAEAEKESEAVTEPESVPARDPALEASVRDILAHELARRVEQRLMAELPGMIESTVRDFLAEQEKIATLQPRD